MDKNELFDLINQNVKKSERSSFKALGFDNEPMWQEPLVGFASGGDADFEFFKKDIGDFYWTPAEAFRLKYKNSNVVDNDLTVISLGFAQTEMTKQLQREEKTEPTPRWLTTRGEWEPLMEEICSSIVNELENGGVQAVAIDLLPELCWMKSEKYGKAAKWSHRHAAFVAGLGTFGLSDGLITRQGKAMRFTTFIIKGQYEPDKREYSTYHEWCKFFKDGSCGVCITRCPAGAITKNGHDKEKCSEYEDLIREKLIREGIMDPKYIGSCGLCQCKVPCQDSIPK